ncbi:MAG: methyltransferase domain-containing protein [Ignavibacteriaceae bacterium]|jgi:2-polyprenyl-3-methyl-5-hydroxy-6-metoxy-1,4-benzoquinol methylase|nr:methyltransferase domain-containing protein [Ignavibacteriaceae bacterium]
MTWYKDWFNSENYLRVYSHRNQEEAERLVDLIAKILNLPANSSVLDMACGAGRHAITFAKMGYKVTAVDLSNLLISEAKKNAEQGGVELDFVLSDILEFETNKKFDLTVNLFTSIGYFDNDEENYAVIKKAYDLLKSGGHFVIDYFNKEFLLKNMIPMTVFSENGQKIIQNRSIDGTRIVKKIIIANNGSSEEFYESVRLYSFEEIINYIKKAGFTIVKQYGDYFGNNYESESSPRLIIFAMK